MALFGTLKDFPFEEIVRLVGSKSGVLVVSFAQRELELHINERQLCGLTVNGQSIGEARLARNWLALAQQQHDGQFQFQKLAPAALEQHFQLALHEQVATGQDPQSYAGQLPDPETVFELRQAPQQLSPALWAFWDQARPALQHGSSSQALAKQLHLKLEDVQLQLFQLRAAGAITPVRRALAQAEVQRGTQRDNNKQPHNSYVPQGPSLVSRLLGALGWRRTA
jgi:hypothetical protein